MSAYRPEPKPEPTARMPILWRPWMARLGVALVVLASPVSAVVATVAAENRWPGKENPPGYITLALVIHLLTGALTMIAIPIIAHEEPKLLTPRLAMKVAWAWIVYPVIWAKRGARWIASGDAP